MRKKYLLVCEGPTDILVINKIAKKISQSADVQIEIQELSPQRDATTRRYPNHGWEEVRQWCRLYGTSIDITSNSIEALAAKDRNWRTQLALSGAEAIIIQMDTDIVSYITDLATSYAGTTKQARKGFAQNAILNWLGESSLPDSIYLLLSTQSTETWLLATHERTEEVFSNLSDNFDFENIDNVIELLCSLNFQYICYDEGNRKKLSKSNYTPYAMKIIENLQKVRRECDEVEKFCTFLLNSKILSN